MVSIIALMLMYSSMLKLVGFPGMEESFLLWGYSKAFMIIVGIVEMALSILVFAKPTRKIGLAGLIFLMIGALFTHISNDEYNEITSALFLLILATCSFVLMFMKENTE
ncbi:MAG: DoxX family protein [Saprospiraceae bacterium]|nr:DoxX family protein [Saprospiraceae bacterium]